MREKVGRGRDWRAYVLRQKVHVMAVPLLGILRDRNNGQQAWNTVGEWKEAEGGQKETTGAWKH